MCLGIPGLLVEVDPPTEFATGLVEFAGVRRRVSLACVPEAVPGDYVLIHAGLALSRIDEEEAGRVFEMIRALDPGALDEVR
ncbi:MAG: HypC/HybG/HupF family hydrogenase formation chaperone [Gemmataceae bacterium]|nr:HypC/HybG/HupF family hydrogenase formation chaperone [Gemmataceae bacterium]